MLYVNVNGKRYHSCTGPAKPATSTPVQHCEGWRGRRGAPGTGRVAKSAFTLVQVSCCGGLTGLNVQPSYRPTARVGSDQMLWFFATDLSASLRFSDLKAVLKWPAG